MADLIDRQAATDAINKAFDRETLLNSFVRKIAFEAVKNLPSADVVEVVRCKDCKFNPNDTWFDCPMAHLPYKEDRWCWKGERKDG